MVEFDRYVSINLSNPFWAYANRFRILGRNFTKLRVFSVESDAPASAAEGGDFRILVVGGGGK
jgi:hypothetical protein